jgi:hypothetical protein
MLITYAHSNLVTSYLPFLIYPSSSYSSSSKSCNLLQNFFIICNISVTMPSLFYTQYWHYHQTAHPSLCANFPEVKISTPYLLYSLNLKSSALAFGLGANRSLMPSPLGVKVLGEKQIFTTFFFQLNRVVVQQTAIGFQNSKVISHLPPIQNRGQMGRLHC